jgi:hypothetical protein
MRPGLSGPARAARPKPARPGSQACPLARVSPKVITQRRSGQPSGCSARSAYLLDGQRVPSPVVRTTEPTARRTGRSERPAIAKHAAGHPPKNRRTGRTSGWGSGYALWLGLVCGVCRLSAGGARWWVCAGFGERRMGRTAGAFRALVVVRGGRRAPPARAPAGPGRRGRWRAARPCPRDGCEMSGGAKAVQPGEVIRLGC